MSIFSDWQEDTPEIVDRCLSHDFKHWRAGRVVLEKPDLNMIKNFIRDNFAAIKEVRMGAIANSGTPPQLKIREFLKLFVALGVPDKHFTK